MTSQMSITFVSKIGHRYLVAISYYRFNIGINATLNPSFMLIEGTYINCDVGAFWAVFSVALGVLWAVFKVGFLQECGISPGDTGYRWTREHVFI